jgi:hypothetical protein
MGFSLAHCGENRLGCPTEKGEAPRNVQRWLRALVQKCREMEWRQPFGCDFATTSAEERVVSGFEWTLMNILWHHQKTSVKEDVDGNGRRS